MEKEKEIEKLKALLLEKSSLANVEPVFTDENGNEYSIDNEKALKVLNDILEQAFIPFIAEQTINAGYGNVKQAEEEIQKYKDLYVACYRKMCDHHEQVLVEQNTVIKLEDDIKLLELRQKKVIKQAVREFAEKLKEKARWVCDTKGTLDLMVSVGDIKAFIKEIYGEERD